MPPVTEVATLFLKAGIDVDDHSSPSFQVAREAFSTISRQPGFQRMHYGLEVEDSSLLQLFIAQSKDWDSIESHQQFTASPGYADFSRELGKLTTKAPCLIHMVPKPFPPAIIGATSPVIEVVTFFQTEDFFLSHVEQFMDNTHAHMDGYLGHAFGPVVEQIEKVEGDGNGPAVMLWIGWESREKHWAFRDTKSFAENIHLLREGLKGSELHHVVFKSFQVANG